MSATTIPAQPPSFEDLAPWNATESRTAVREHAAAGRREVVEQAERLMMQRLADPELSLNDIARALFISRRHLQRAFSESGSPGYRYEITRMRVRVGAALIKRHPNRPIERIAHEVGYLDASQFSKSFRRQFKVSPRHWRRMCRERAGSAPSLATAPAGV
jgi:transcriptional regulator GlxA family with amidase domain